MYFSFLFSFILVLWNSCSALHEDQAGLNDWRAQFVGRPLEILHSDVSTHVYTDQNVLASVGLLKGDIVWRHVLETTEDHPVVNVPDRRMFITDDAVCVLVQNGRIIRCFHKLTGILLLENVLSSRSTTESPSSCAVVQHGDEDGLFCINNERKLLISAKDGHVMWQQPSPASTRTWVFSVANGDLVAVSYSGNDLRIEHLVIGSGEQRKEERQALEPNTKPLRCAMSGTVLVCLATTDDGLVLLSYAQGSRLQKFAFHALNGMDLQNLRLEAHGKDSVLLVAERKDVLFHADASGRITLLHEGIVSNARANGDFYVASKMDNGQVEVALGRVENGKLVSTSKNALSFPANLGQLEKLSLFSNEYPVALFVSSTDVFGRLHLSTSQEAIVWKREEGLASIVTASIVDLPISDIEALVEDEFQDKGSPVVRFMKRFVSQGLQLYKTAQILLHRLTSSFGGPPAPRRDHFERDYFNTHKLLVTVTKKGSVIALDSRTASVVYSLSIPDFALTADGKAHFYLQRSGAHDPFPSQAVIVASHKSSGGALLYFFDCITGQRMSDPVILPAPALRSGLIPIMTANHLEPLFVVDKDLNLRVYPTLNNQEIDRFIARNLFVFDVNWESGTARGLRMQTLNGKTKAAELWSSVVAVNGESVVAVKAKRPHDVVHSQGKVLGDRRVQYKYANPNLVAVAVQGTDDAKKPYVKVVALDGVTGRTIVSVVHRRAKGPVHIVHAEHWIMYTYLSEKTKAHEIGVVELYRGFDKLNSTQFSSMDAAEKPDAFMAAFKLPGFVTALADTVTVEGMTHKTVIAALSSGSLMSIQKVLLDPRRPMMPTQAEREEGLVAYSPEIPLMPESVVNYYNKVERVRGIATGMTGLESISVVFAYGLDLFFTRVTPSGQFDVLSDSFDYWILSVVMVLMTVASLVCRHLSSAKALKQAWK